MHGFRGYETISIHQRNRKLTMTRSDAIKHIKAHAAAGNMAACTRIYCEARISRAVYDQAVADGRALGAFIAKRDKENTK